MTEEDIRGAKNPEDVMRMAKKGQMVMLFVTVSGIVLWFQSSKIIIKAEI